MFIRQLRLSAESVKNLEMFMSEMNYGKSYIEKMAQLFLLEGDIETANALRQQLVEFRPREMTDEEVVRYKAHKSNLRKAIGYGDLERAVEFQEQALAIKKKSYGIENIETLKDIGELGECFYRIGAFSKAHDQYAKAFRVSLTMHGKVHPFSVSMKEKLEKCAQASSRLASMRNLEECVNRVFRMGGQDQK